MASSFFVSFFAPLLVLLFLAGIYCVPFDLYKRRYDIQKATINSTFFKYDPTYKFPGGNFPGPYWKSLHPEYINATFNAVKASGKTFPLADEISFRYYIGLNYTQWGTVRYVEAYDLSNLTRILHTFGSYQAGMYVLPNVYNEIKFKNVTTWGPAENLLTILTPVWSDVAWQNIKDKYKSGRCKAFDILGLQWFNLFKDTVGNATYFSKYDPALCAITKDTMAKWYVFLQDVQNLVSPNTFTSRIFDSSQAFTALKFMRFAKLYRPAVYDAYFESSTNYPLVQAMKNTSTLPIFTLQEKNYIRQIAVNFQTEFPNLATIQARQDFMSKKFSEIIDQNPTHFETFAKIPLNNNEGIFYDLIIWTCQKDELEAAYQKALTY